jgi:guanylate kinase
LGAFADRLRRRGTEDEESIARRLETARRELTRAGEYQHLIRNDELETATSDLTAVIEREFSKGV